MADNFGMNSSAANLIRFVGRHRKTVTALLVLAGVAALVGILGGAYDNDVSKLFPETPESSAMFRVLREAHLADAAQLEFIDPSGIEKHEAQLEQIAAKLAELPNVRNVAFRYRSDDPGAEISSFARLAPRFTTPEFLDECDPGAAVKNALGQLAFPVPGALARIRRQPFGTGTRILEELRELDKLTGMKLAADLPYFASADKTRAMITFDADVRVGDADAVRKLLSEVRQCVGTLPDGVRRRLISGSLHTLGNEETLKRDAAVSGAVSLGLFLLIFVFFYRGDVRALWIPVIPLYASLLSLGLMTLFFREICWYVIGLGGCITGLAVDQGIHVYAAFHGADAESRTANLAKPMILSGATSIAVFFLLAASGIPAYIQLALFAGPSLALSCLLALTVLPQLLRSDREALEIKILPRTAPRRFGVLSLAFLLFAALGAVYGGKRLLGRADFSLRSLDGTPREILAAEADFRAAWRSDAPRTAILAALGNDAEDALARLKELSNVLEERGVRVTTTPRPTLAEQRRDLAAWRTPESRRKLDELEARTRRACAAQGLPETFFDPYFSELRSAVASDDLSLPPLLDNIDRRMVKSRPGGAAAIALLRDDPHDSAVIREELAKRRDGLCALLSEESFRSLIRDEVGSKFAWIMPLALVSALLFALAVFRNIGDVLRAMIPVGAALGTLAVVGGAVGFRATPAAAFALILLTGLAVDYGIYAVCQSREPEKFSVNTSIVLSAATTIAGAGALMCSRHPALFDTGAVLSIGIAVAAASGLFLTRLSFRIGASGKVLAAFFAALLTLSGCATRTAFEDAPDAEAIAERLRIYPDAPFRVEAAASVEADGKTLNFLLAAEVDPQTGTVRAAGVNAGSGALLFGPGDAASPFATAESEHLERLFRALREDLKRIFLHNCRRPLAVRRETEYIAVYSDDEVESRLYDRGLELRRDGCFFGIWRCEFRDSGRTVDYRRFRPEYRLRLKINKLETKRK